MINWTNCLRTRPWVREQWASEHGLEGVDGPEYDRHLDAVFERLSVNDRCSDLNGPHQRMKEGAERARLVVPDDRPQHRPGDATTRRRAAYIGFGDQSGSKLSTQKTFLQDAFDAGADIVVRCFVERVLVENGRAAGVEGTWTDPETGRSARVTVRAPQVVVACGVARVAGAAAALAGSAARRPATTCACIPCTAMFGIYGEDQKAWWGAPQAGLVDEFADVEDGYGFLIESAQYAPALIGSALPFTGAARAQGDDGEGAATARPSSACCATTATAGSTIDARRAGGSLLLAHRRARRAQHAPRRSTRRRACTRPPARARSTPLAAGAPRWRAGRRPRRTSSRGAQRVPLRLGGCRLFCRPPDGHAAGWAPTRATSVAGPVGRAARHAGRVDRRRQRLPDRPRAPTR